MKLAHSIACLSFSFLAGCTTKDSPRVAGDTTAVVQAAPEAEPTANDISDYRLDMDRMQRYSAALRGFVALARTDSAAAEAMASNSNESTAQMIAKIEASPSAMKVLRDARLTAKEYVWITAAYLQAAMTEAALEANPNAKLPAGQNRQNVEFVRAHKAELEELTRDMR